ncbi:MAG: DegT/DnrJ/EryC1/StrS family aminotransferase, partial [Flavobacteriales bacterium]|nr:DegT/DnrJ/EryC1/StrS family aminotransferase [Flavobacteriales bacterium]
EGERPVIPEGTGYNHAYYPILLRDSGEREAMIAKLAAQGVHARRYFFPSLDTLPYVKAQACPVSRDLADRALCLPLFNGMNETDMERVTRVAVHRSSVDATARQVS